MTEEEELEKINKEIATRKAELNKQEMVVVPEKKDINVILEEKKQEILQTEQVESISKVIVEEKIKADLSSEASKIRTQNIETAENEFENETRELKLKNKKAELNLQHKYNMDNIKKTAKFKQMLDKRKQLVIKYSYLYESQLENCITLKDSEDNDYLAPKDFSFSLIVNLIRQLGRNISKLNKPILQFIKTTITLGSFILGYLLLKKLGVI